MDPTLACARPSESPSPLSLAPLSALPDAFAPAVSGLSTLCLNRTGMAWSQLLFLAGSIRRGAGAIARPRAKI